VTGAEVAWRTLRREIVDEPCIIGCWMMKRDFFTRYAGVGDIYADPVRTAVEAFAEAGCNLNPQFIMPSPIWELRACDPFNLPPKPWVEHELETPDSAITAEDIRDELEGLPEAEVELAGFDEKREARAYAGRLKTLTDMSRERTLYIGSFGLPSFMAGYTRWSYESYLTALVLYPGHFRRFFRIEAEKARAHNLAIREAVRFGAVAPVVYTGDDICFNDGPICSVELLEDLYFPALEYALEPLVEAGIDIVWHCDGNVLPIVPRLIRMGISGFQGFQEREARIPIESMASFCRHDGGKLVFFGSVSVVHTFPFGTVADMREEIERCYRILAPGGGFCLAPSSSVLPETPLENVVTFMEYGIEYGRRWLRGEKPRRP
jgi:hypothetical protein